MKNRIHLLLSALLLVSFAAQAEPFVIGGDLSALTKIESLGGVYREGGTERDVLAILKDQGFNTVRLRLFVDPNHEQFVINDLDYAPIFLWSAHRDEEMDEKRELKQVHRLLDRRIDGVVLWPHFARMYEQHIHEFSLRNLPVVTVDCRINGSTKADSVLSDDRAGAKAVAGPLVELGHRHIIHFCGPGSEEWARMRREAFAAETDCLTVEVPNKPPRTAVVREALGAHPETTAIFASNDHIARDVYEVAAELELRIPEDLSVVGYSDLEFAQYLGPPLTTVHACPYEMGRRAARMVIERIAGDEGTEMCAEYLPAELVVRKSTSAV